MSQKKVIALLEEGGSFAISTINYYLTLYPNFINCEIVDNKQNVEYMIELLNKYYKEGYRVFCGPFSTPMVEGVIGWFGDHLDAIGLTPVTLSNSLIFPKNFYRLQPSDFYFMDYIASQVDLNVSKVFYFYNQNRAGIDLLTKIESLFYSDNIYTYPVVTNDDLNVAEVQSFFDTNGITVNDIVIVYLNHTQRNKYFNLFYDINIGNVKQYDVLPTGFPQVLNDVINLYGNYNCILSESINTTSIYNNGVDALGIKYATNVLTTMYLLTLLANNESIDNAYSYGEVVPWFDDNNGIKYWSYNIYLYNSNGFTKTNIYLNDPSYGILTFNKKV
jgi:hypothetical protein